MFFHAEVEIPYMFLYDFNKNEYLCRQINRNLYGTL